MDAASHLPISATPATSPVTQTAPSSSSSPAPLDLRVLTVNIHKGFTSFNRRFMLHELREAVRDVAADVVFLQEVLGSHSRHTERVENFPDNPHYEFLADSIWPQFAYGRNAVYDKGHHGNALLSKFPIVHHENHDVSISGPERRGLLHCVMELPGRDVQLHAICAHLGLQEHHRRKQLLLMCDLIEKQIPANAPIVVAGDFNDWRCRAHDILAKGANLREVFVHAAGRAAKTFPAKRPMLQLDRIYVRNATLRSTLALPRNPWAELSDHAPLAAELTL